MDMFTNFQLIDYKKFFANGENCTYKNYITAVKNCGIVLKYVDVHALYYDEYINICKVAIKQDPYSLVYVDAKRMNTNEFSQICLRAVKQNGMCIEFVPDIYRTYELCLCAVKQSGIAIKYIKKGSMPTVLYYTLCNEAVSSNYNSLLYIDDLDSMPLDIYIDLCKYAIKQHAVAIKYVKPELISENVYVELCRESVNYNPGAIKYVPIRYVDTDMCISAVKQDGLLLGYILKNKNISDFAQIAQIGFEAIEQTPFALQYLDKEYQTTDIICNAIYKDIGVLKWVDKSLIDTIDISLVTGETITITTKSTPLTSTKYIKCTNYLEKEIETEYIKTYLDPVDYIKSKANNFEITEINEIAEINEINNNNNDNKLYMIKTDNIYDLYKFIATNTVQKGWFSTQEVTKYNITKINSYEVCYF
jgi:hypothetical protein